MTEIPDLKRCPTCRELKPLTDFPPRWRNHKPDPHRSGYCRACAARRMRTISRTMSGRYRTSRAIAKRRNIPFTLTREEYTALRSQPCAYCGGTLPETGLGLDKIDHTGGYTLGNVVPCCEHCNRIKADVFTFEEMKLLGVVVAQIIAARGGHRIKSAYGKGASRRFEDLPAE